MVWLQWGEFTRLSAPHPHDITLYIGAPMKPKTPPSKKFAAFEKSGADKDTKGAKEGSKKDMATDKKQFTLFTKKKG